MKKAVVVFSGGVDSVCTCAFLKPKYQLYGISFSYGQRASQEINMAKKFAKIVGLKEHKIVDISFMKNLYGKTMFNRFKRKFQQFEYSIVVPLKRCVSLPASSLDIQLMTLVVYGAHTGTHYPDCRPSFSRLESASTRVETDGIKSVRENRNLSPYKEDFQKYAIKNRLQKFGDSI